MSRNASPSLEFAFVCPLSGGLHARPASHLAETANEFASECILANTRNGSMASLKSVLAIISADVRHGDRCTIQVSGDDSQQAQAALLRFVTEALPDCDVPFAVLEAVVQEGAIPRVLRSSGIPFCFGSPVSPGIGQGKVVFLDGMSLRIRNNGRIPADPQKEWEQIQRATNAVCARLREKLKHSQSSAETGILQADLAIARDVALAQKLRNYVLQGKSAEEAISAAGEFFVNLLRHSENEFIRERALDIEEICVQLLGELQGGESPFAGVELSQPSVVVAETLAPAQLLTLDRRRLVALALGHSGATSHAVILARSLGIPTIVGVKNARQLLAPGQEVIVDAIRGIVATQVSPAVGRFYQNESRVLEERRQSLLSRAGTRATTMDGKSIEVAANAASYDELRLAFENGADRIGLFRTEGLFLGRDHPPSEEEQFEIYAHAARLAEGRAVILRTFDLGADKPAPYLHLQAEKNPFLGLRGVRLYREHRELLHTQLRAILRASAIGPLQIMAPMIASLEEVIWFKSAIAAAKHELARTGLTFASDIRIGIMLEVPSACFVLDQLSPEVDFFSLGTNDLNQYFLAADRDNPQLAELSNVLHPGFVRFLRQIVEEVHLAGKWIGMCGQMAAEIPHLPLLLGLGLDEISVPAARIPEMKQAISRLSASDGQALLTRTSAFRERAENERPVEPLPRALSSQPLLIENLIRLESESGTKEEAIQEIVNALYLAERAEDRLRLEEALWSREAIYSTGLGYGFAAPHCKTDSVTADSIAVLKLKQPIDWGSVDNQPVRMIIPIVMREPQQDSRHMEVFSKLARKLMSEEFRQRLLSAETARDMTIFLATELELSLDSESSSAHAEVRGSLQEDSSQLG